MEWVLSAYSRVVDGRISNFHIYTIRTDMSASAHVTYDIPCTGAQVYAVNTTACDPRN